MTDTEEPIDVPVREYLPAIRAQTVSLPASIDKTIQEWEAYQELTCRLLDDSDYQSVGSKRFKKKSAWRKYAKAFHISDQVTFEKIERDERGFPLFARIRVRATHVPSGRYAEADHECHVFERCCPAAEGQPCTKKGYHTHCTKGCNGKIHWSHPGDLPATATTRAKNRAISDLIGAGEVSAEEMTEQDRTTTEHSEPQSNGAAQANAEPKCPKCGKTDLWDNRKERKQAIQDIADGKREKKPPPAWKCKDKACGGVIWEEEEPAQSSASGARSTLTVFPLYPSDDEVPDWFGPLEEVANGSDVTKLRDQADALPARWTDADATGKAWCGWILARTFRQLLFTATTRSEWKDVDRARASVGKKFPGIFSAEWEADWKAYGTRRWNELPKETP